MRVVAVLLVVFVIFVHTAKIRRFLHVDRAEVCNKSANAQQDIYDIHVVNQPRGYPIISFKVAVKADQSKNFRAEVLVTRCTNKEALDTCEPFTTLRPLNFCQVLKMPNTPWASVYQKSQPPLSCPFKKGNYTFPSSSIDFELFTVFSLDSYYWKIKIFARDQDVQSEIVVCADAYMKKIMLA